MRILRSLLCLIVFLFVGSAEANACSCAFGGGVVCQDFWKASAVFVGTVIESKTVTVKRGQYELRQRLVRFSLDEPFRGVQGAEVEVMTGMGGGDCGIAFVQTRQYLVYASSVEGKLQTGICMRTKVISDAVSDLDYIRGLNEAKPGGAVFGEVSTYERNEKGDQVRKPVSGAKIIIDGADTLQTSTDANGAYRVDGLLAGNYTVRISPPPAMTARETERKISLANGGCAGASFFLENNAQLNGRILNPQGLPINKAEVFLIEYGKERYRGHTDAAYSNEEGKYAFNLIPPGRYVLSIRFDGLTSQNRPFPMMYYPGVSDRTQAQVITIEEGQTIANYDLGMPSLPLEYQVTGSVEWAKGKPAPGARVEYMVVADAVSYGVRTDGADFSFAAYEGLKLTMRASIETEKGKNVYSNWVHFTVMAGLPAIKLILPEP